MSVNRSSSNILSVLSLAVLAVAGVCAAQGNVVEPTGTQVSVPGTVGFNCKTMEKVFVSQVQVKLSGRLQKVSVGIRKGAGGVTGGSITLPGSTVYNLVSKDGRTLDLEKPDAQLKSMHVESIVAIDPGKMACDATQKVEAMDYTLCKYVRLHTGNRRIYVERFHARIYSTREHRGKILT